MARTLNQSEREALAAMVGRTSVAAVMYELRDYAVGIAAESKPSPFKRSWERTSAVLHNAISLLLNL